MRIIIPRAFFLTSFIIDAILYLAEKDKSWDEDIWSFAINLSKSICKRTTPKTIYFQ
jgi:hypothetical protein